MLRKDDRSARSPFRSPERHDLLRRVLLACGIGYGAVYIVANDVVAAAMWDGYSRTDQAISELSGTAAPSQGFLVAMIPVFSVLLLAYGVGVWLAAGSSRTLRGTAGLLVAQGLLGFVWLLFPMTSRDVAAAGGGGANDVGHIVLGALAITLILVEMALSAVALGRRFRIFTCAAAVAVVAGFGYMATVAPNVAAGAPTPWMGLAERVGYWAWIAWIAVLAIVLMRGHGEEPGRRT